MSAGPLHELQREAGSHDSHAVRGREDAELERSHQRCKREEMDRQLQLWLKRLEVACCVL